MKQDPVKPPDLPGLRAELDAIDSRLLQVLSERQALIRRAAEIKAMSSTQIHDALREEEILARLGREAVALGLPQAMVTTLFRLVLDYSVRHQIDHLLDHHNPRPDAPAVRVAYQGGDGAYSHVAAKNHFTARAGDKTYHGYPTFRAILEAVDRGQADYAMLPIENTTAGSINDAYDLLATMALSIVGEEVLKIEHCLIALEPVPITHIRRVISHPQALAQCGEFLASLSDCAIESYIDTALAVQRVKEEKDLSLAAVASAEAARIHGLHVIQRSIANQEANFTRFVVAAKNPVIVDTRVPCKTSLVFITRHERGALLRCLNVLADHGLSLTKLESRPLRNTPWEYQFYADVEGNLADPQTEAAIAVLSECTSNLKVLGSYPARVAPPKR